VRSKYDPFDLGTRRAGLDVRFGSKADICAAKRMSAFPRKRTLADISQTSAKAENLDQSEKSEGHRRQRYFAVNSFKSAAKESTSSFVVSQLHIRRA
jgi:hypothetical protein